MYWRHTHLFSLSALILESWFPISKFHTCHTSTLIGGHVVWGNSIKSVLKHNPNDWTWVDCTKTPSNGYVQQEPMDSKTNTISIFSTSLNFFSLFIMHLFFSVGLHGTWVLTMEKLKVTRWTKKFDYSKYYCNDYLDKPFWMANLAQLTQSYGLGWKTKAVVRFISPWGLWIAGT